MSDANVVTLATPPKIAVSVIFDVVSISFHCGDAYEAQVLYDDIAARLNAGEKMIIEPRKDKS